MTPENIASLMTRLTMTWPNFRIPTDPDTAAVMIQVWCDELDQISQAEAIQAVKSLSAEGRDFPPPVGMIRKRALELRQQITGVGVPNEAEAWAEVKHLIARRGWPSPPQPADCSHPAIHRAITAMSWSALCESTNEVADRAHFLRLFAATADVSRDHYATQAGRLASALAPMLDTPRTTDEDDRTLPTERAPMSDISQ